MDDPEMGKGYQGLMRESEVRTRATSLEAPDERTRGTS
jgi:hypothetical protein